MAGQILIYGAYGYTGELIAREAVKMGLTPRLGGRDATRLGPLAEELGLEWVAFGVDDRAATRAALDGIDTLLNCAGPFRETYAALTEACLATHTHYLDITGEIDVLAGCAALDERAKAAGITIMPGTGFDVVPTDCMAAMLKEHLPDGNKLTLAFKGMAQASRGTAMSSIPHLGNPPYVRRDGDLVPRPGGVFSTLDMGEGPERVAQRIRDMAQGLLDEAGVLMFPGNSFGPRWKNWVRVSLLAREEDIGEAMRRMREFVEQVEGT